MLSAISEQDIYATLKKAKAYSHETSIYIYISLHGATFYKTECIIILLVRAANMTWIEIVQDKI
jgi:hypothetical protein